VDSFLNSQEILTALSWGKTLATITEERDGTPGHPVMDEGSRHLHDRTHEKGLEWLGGTISRYELLSANCLKVLPSERISLAGVVSELTGIITNLKAIEAHLLAATQTIASPATPPSLPSTAASPDAPFTVPPPSAESPVPNQGVCIAKAGPRPTCSHHHHP